VGGAAAVVLIALAGVLLFFRRKRQQAKKDARIREGFDKDALRLQKIESEAPKYVYKPESAISSELELKEEAAELRGDRDWAELQGVTREYAELEGSDGWQTVRSEPWPTKT
jgi:hypothetical protein